MRDDVDEGCLCYLSTVVLYYFSSTDNPVPTLEGKFVTCGTSAPPKRIFSINTLTNVTDDRWSSIYLSYLSSFPSVERDPLHARKDQLHAGKGDGPLSSLSSFSLVYYKRRRTPSFGLWTSPYTNRQNKWIKHTRTTPYHTKRVRLGH